MTLKLEKLSILVVEDTPPMRKLIVSVLESLGVGKIYTASNGDQGFSVYQQTNPDIIITDWLMEPVDGIEFINKVRTHVSSPNRTVPMIIITGYSAITRVMEARDNGVTEFLIKPFTANDLAKRIAYVINKPRDFVHAPKYFGPDRRRKKDDAVPVDRRKNQGEKVNSVPDIGFAEDNWTITSR
jgi:two-component system chemotaxis response regulator CheY